MSTAAAIAVFLSCLAVSLISSVVLAERIDQIGTWLGLSEGLLGLAMALGADSPEIASAMTAIIRGNHDLGLGVVFGSNIFNLAALMGVGAIAAGCVRVGVVGLWFDGGVGLAVAVIVAARMFGWIGTLISIVLVAIVLVPYLLVSAVKPEHLENWSMQPRLKRVLQRILTGRAHEKRKDQTPQKPSVIDRWAVVPALVAVVVASVGMVEASIVLGNHWHVSDVVIGMLVLATLTGIPNTISAVRLALRGRGTAVVSETLNSNSVNLLIGAMLPVLIFGASKLDSLAKTAIVWSIAMTVLALVLASFRSGLTRLSGSMLVAVYVLFAALVLVLR